MPSLRITDFGGIKPKDSRSTGNASRASLARDVKLDSGTLKPWRYPSKDICSNLDCICSLHFQDCCIVASENSCAYFAKGDTNCNRVFSTGVMPYPSYAILPENCDCGEIPELEWKRLGVPAPKEEPIFSVYPEKTAKVIPQLEQPEQIEYNCESTSNNPGEDKLHGTVVLNDDGTITYTPEEGYTGQAQFSYTISDGNGGESTATVTIDVTETGGGVNTPPVAAGDNDTTEQDTSITIPSSELLDNDSDADGDTLTITSVQAVQVTVGAEVCNYDLIQITPDPNAYGWSQQEHWESRAYAFSYVNELGEEGPISPISEVVVGNHNACATILLNNLTLDDGFEVTSIKIYRVASGFTDSVSVGEGISLEPESTLFLVGEIDYEEGVIEYEDCLDPIYFNEVYDAQNNFPPLACLDNLDMLEDGTLVASEGKNLWFSSPWKFHAWDCYMNLDDCIETVSVVGQYIYITTNSNPYVLDVRTSAKEDCKCCRPVNKILEKLPIVSKRSVTKIGNGIMWATETGLVRMRGGGQVDIVTHSSMSQDDWLEWNPHRIHAVFYKGKYFGFNDHRGFIYDINDGIYSETYPGEEAKFTELSFTPSGAFVSDQNIMYLAFDGDLYRWDNSDTFMPYTWKSKLHVEGGLSNYSAMKVVFHDWLRTHTSPNPVTISIYVDDNLRFTRTVSCSKPFRLPKGYDGLNYEIEIQGIEEVMEIHMASSMKELVLLNNT